MLFKEIVDGRTHTWTTDIEGSQKLTEHFVLRSAKNEKCFINALKPQPTNLNWNVSAW